ncbi:MAG: sulfate permease [Pseudomonadota bacterium]|nr:sulfate permease [Pseudomonadota bacterium]
MNLLSRLATRLRPSLPAWLGNYQRGDLPHDLVAGLVTAILLVPQGMAFALLAGLPAQVGLYAGIVPPLVYALLGSSRTLAVGPVSVAAIMVAHALSQHATPETYLAHAMALALLSGLILLLMGWLRLGVLVSLLSHPVLSGFTSAAAVVIIISQLPNLTGLHLDSFTSLSVPFQFSIQPAILMLGLVSAAALLLMGRPLEIGLVRLGLAPERARLIGRGGPLAVVLLATGLALLPTLRPMIPLVGAIPAGLPGLESGFLGMVDWNAHFGELLPSALLIALVGYVESIAIAKSLAHRRRETVAPNRELLALGAANLGAAFTGGMPVAGGFSRTMVNFNAGARTQMAGLITAVLVGLVALTLTGVLQYIPKAALGAIIVVAVAKLIDFSALKEAWHYDRMDASVILATFAGVLILGIEHGLLAGIGASLVLYVWRSRQPHVAVVGRIPGSEQFRNVVRHSVETSPNLLLVRIDENLNFANAEYLEQELTDLVAAQPEIRHLVLIASSVNHIDSSALSSLEKLIPSLREAGVTLHLAEIKGPLRDRLERSALPSLLNPGRIFTSTHQAVAELSDSRDRAHRAPTPIALLEAA